MDSIEVGTHEIIGALEIISVDCKHIIIHVKGCTHCAGSWSSRILSWIIGGGSTGFRSTTKLTVRF